jgi:hypothetical protein
MFGALGPIVAPTDNDIATRCRVSVVAEIPAFKFKLDAHALPSFRSYLPHGLAVGEPGLNGLDQVAEFFGEHAKEKYDALLVDRFMPQAAEARGIAIGNAIF